MKNILWAGVVALVLAGCDSPSDEKIRSYLMENPEVVMEVLENAVQHKRQLDATKKQSALDGARAPLAEKNPATYISGKGDITLVEFFDYQCGYCKKAHPQVLAAIAQDKNIKFILKEFPILGETSMLASRAAIAARAQGKYRKLHNAFMSTPGRLDEKKIFSIARKVGINTKRLRADMKNAAIQKALDQNFALAQTLGIRGTPGFVLFNDRHIESLSGVRSTEELVDLFSSMRVR